MSSYSNDDGDFGDDDGLFLIPGERPIPGQDWVLVKRLGDPSGFGEVWLAKDEALQSYGVFKFCKDPNKDETVFGLHNEVDKLRAVSHDGIVRLTAANLRATPPFLQYEYIPDSCDLAELLKKLHPHVPVGSNTAQSLINKQQSLTNHLDACQLILTIAKTLQYCHSLTPPLVHRDIKPANILVLDYGLLELAHALGDDVKLGQLSVKLLDFGLSTRIRMKVDDTQYQQSLGRVFDGYGTWAYCSPQQRSDDPDYRPCPSDDIYSLGVTWWQMITGRMPKPEFTEDDYREGLRDVELKDALKSIVLRCVARSADRRIRGGNELVEVLSNALVQSPRRPATRDSLRELLSTRDTADLSHLKQLTTFQAATLVELTEACGTDPLILDGLTEISEEVAQILSRHEGFLSLGGLREVSPWVAKSLASGEMCITQLCLDRLSEITPAVAESLSLISGLRFGGLSDLPLDVANGLLQGNCFALSLGGLDGIEPQVAAVLAEFERLDIEVQTLSSASAVQLLNDSRRFDSELSVVLKGPMTGELAGIFQRTVRRFGSGMSWWSELDPYQVLLRPWTITAAACRMLSPQGGQGWLCEDHLQEVSSPVAELLCGLRAEESECKANGFRMYLSRIRGITPDVAAILSLSQAGDKPGFLSLDSISLGELTFDIAQRLARFRGTLKLKDFEGDAPDLIKSLQAL